MSKSTEHDSATGNEQLPAQKAMKQLSKTPAERNEGEGKGAECSNDSEADREQGNSREPLATRGGDAGAGQSENEGSSPYADRSRKDAPQRDS